MTRTLWALVCLPLALAQDPLKEFEKRVTEFTLSNGWRFLIVERHQSPVASFYTYVDVGSANDVKGITGMAHMFEHMAFKGTRSIGTKNYAEEKNALDRVDQAFAALKRERAKPGGGDKAEIERLDKEFRAAQEGAGKFVETNEFSIAIDRAGGRGVNASTGYDRTDYSYSLPTNSSELWFYLESERFREPVFREFYKEAGVVREERRMRVESQPVGKLVDELLATAFSAHPYGETGVGHMSDLSSFTTADAAAFYKRYYQPSNMMSVIVGDVDPKQMRAFAERYMGRLPSDPRPEGLRTVEPEQPGERRFLLRRQAQRFTMIGYHIPAITHPDYAVYTAVGNLLSAGRSSRLNDRLVNQQKIAVAAGGFPGFPGDKYPALFLFLAIPAPGKTNQDIEKSMLAEVEKLKTEPVTGDELEGVKNRRRSGLIATLGSNTAIGPELAKWQMVTGDWRNVFRFLDKLAAVTPADIQRIAKATFTESNRTVGYLEPIQQ
ncbi:MAG: insulinase family protein [Acidobacteria bacterium]|nr:insulinase family protein [Acidobacteriota bacterium]